MGVSVKKRHPPGRGRSSARPLKASLGATPGRLNRRHHFVSDARAWSEFCASHTWARWWSCGLDSLVTPLGQAGDAGDADLGGVSGQPSRFYATLLHWRELNLSFDFTQLASNCAVQSHTLEQVVFNQRHLFDHLSACAQGIEPLSREPVLHLWLALIQDVQKPEPGVVEGLVDLILDSLAVEAVDIKKAAAIIMARLLAHVRQCRTGPDLMQVLPRFLNRLAQLNPPTRAILAQVLGYALRRSQSNAPLWSQLLPWLADEPAFLARVVVCASTNGTTLSSRSWLAHLAIVQSLTPLASVDLVHELGQALLDIVDPRFVPEGLNPLIDLSQKWNLPASDLLQTWADGPSPLLINSDTVTRLTAYVRTLKPVGQDLLALLRFVCHFPVQEESMIQSGRGLIQTIIEQSVSTQVELMSSLGPLSQHATFPVLIWPALLSLWTQTQPDLALQSEILSELAQHLDERFKHEHVPAQIGDEFLQLYVDQCGIAKVKKHIKPDLAQTLIRGLTGLRIVPITQTNLLVDLWKHVQDILAKNHVALGEKLFDLFCQNLAHSICPNELMDHLTAHTIAKFSVNSPEMLHALSKLCPLDTKHSLKQNLPANFDQTLSANLSARDSQVRRDSAQIMSALWPCPAYTIIAELTSQEVALNNVRDVTMKLQCLQTMDVGGSRTEAKIRFLLGNFWINFTPLWKSMKTVIVKEFSQTNPTDDQQEKWSVLARVINEVLKELSTSTEDMAPKKNIAVFLTQVFSCVSDFEGFNRQAAQGFLPQLFDTAKDESQMQSPRLICAVIKLLAKMQDFKQDTKTFDQVRDLVFMYLSHSNSSIQEEALNFCRSHLKGLSTKKETLAKLTETKNWKNALISYLSDETLDPIDSKVHQVFTRLLLGVVRKTSGLKPIRRRVDRRLIIEQLHRLPSKKYLEHFIESVFEEFSNSNIGSEGRKPVANLELSAEFALLALPYDDDLEADMSAKGCSLMIALSQHLMKDKTTLDTKLRSKFLKMLNDLFSASNTLTLEKIKSTGILETIILPALDCQSDASSGKRQLSISYIQFLNSMLENEQRTSPLLGLFWTPSREGITMLDRIVKVMTSTGMCKIRTQQLLGILSKFVTKFEELEIQGDSLTDAFRVICVQLIEYFGGKTTKKESEILLRCEALAWLYQRLEGHLEEPLIENLMKNICSFAKKRELTDSEFSAWYGVFGKVIQNVGTKIPGETFDLLVKFNTLDRRMKFVPALARAMGFKVSKDDVNSCVPLESLDLTNKLHFQFALKQNVSHIYSEDLSNAVQANANLQKLVKQLKESDQFTRENEDLMMKEVAHALTLDSDTVFSSFIILMRTLVLQDPSDVLQEFKSLVSSDVDEDFFENVRHLQLHRRNKCLISLLAKLKSGALEFREENLVRFVIPLFYRYVLKEKYKKYTDLVSTCMDAVIFLAARLPFRPYMNKVDALLSFETEDKQLSAQRFTIMSRFFANFKFNESNLPEKDCLRVKSFVLKVISRMKSEESERVLHLYVALAKIFDSFPKIMGTNAQSMIIELCNKLKSKDFKYRCALRNTLAHVIKELGKTYFQFLISVLESSLQRGNQVHIMMYSIHFVINQNQEILDADTLASLQDKLLSLIVKELSMASLKDKECYAKNTKNCPEVINVSSYPLITTLATFCDRGSLGSILSRFIGKPSNVTATVALTHWHGVQQKALGHIYMGLTKNQAFEPNDFVILANGILSGRLLSQLNSRYDPTDIPTNLKEFAVDLLLLSLSAEGSIQDGIFMSTLKFVTDELLTKNLAVIPKILRLLVRLHSVPSLHKLVQANVNLNLELFQFLTKNLNQFHALKSDVVFKLSVQILDRVLDSPGDAKFPRGSIMSLKAFVVDHINDASIGTWTVMLRLLERLAPGQTEADGKRMCQMMVMAKSDRDFARLRKFVSKTCSLAVKFNFGIQNLDYDDHEGRRRVIFMLGDMIQDLLKNDARCDVKDLERLFFMVSNRYINEDSQEIQGGLGKLLSLIVELDVRSGDNISLKYVNQCLKKEDEVSRLFAIIVCASGLSRVEHLSCSNLSLNLIVDHLDMLKSCPTKNKSEAYLQLKLIEVSFNLLGQGHKGMQTIFQENIHDLANVILHPNKGIREAFLKVLGRFLETSISFVKEVQLKITNNLLEVLKVSPTQDLVPMLVRICSSFESVQKFVMRRLLGVFRDEKINDVKSFSKRYLILEVAKGLADIDQHSKHEGDIIKMCQESESSPELSDISIELQGVLKRTNPEIEVKVREPMITKAQLKRKGGKGHHAKYVKRNRAS
ncbi:uncharacterized protein LOC131885380 [Tigriopus californicus]|uniref:uncharacterized protein LOC131885380 n=1 Tax=Tigriopus californicus TaxID=6832 RepID=UPI0027DA21CE|nr:uncharacterized protein LOC131885380 [Tigriopus californicus]